TNFEAQKSRAEAFSANFEGVRCNVKRDKWQQGGDKVWQERGYYMLSERILYKLFARARGNEANLQGLAWICGKFGGLSGRILCFSVLFYGAIVKKCVN
ncbi:MAG: hypothetical protein J1F13_06620, partial [Prevotellaceae bacterium]|nr:hypothetical protein [Prevotellaceae bacterium]